MGWTIHSNSDRLEVPTSTAKAGVPSTTSRPQNLTAHKHTRSGTVMNTAIVPPVGQRSEEAVPSSSRTTATTTDYDSSSYPDSNQDSTTNGKKRTTGRLATGENHSLGKATGTTTKTRFVTQCEESVSGGRRGYQNSGEEAWETYVTSNAAERDHDAEYPTDSQLAKRGSPFRKPRRSPPRNTQQGAP